VIKVPVDFDVNPADLAEMVVPNDLRSAKKTEDRIMAELARCGYDADTTFAIKLSLEEAITNAVKHGNGNDPLKHITVRFHINGCRTVIAVRDEGAGFALESVPDPTADENLELPNGRGIMLMQAYMTKLWFNEVGNEVWMLRDRSDKGP
jgi:serine/threonine-protein kinase RsbW